ncbi:MAG: hypothetical protein WCE38_13375 [Burkholderiales bacterium]
MPTTPTRRIYRLAAVCVFLAAMSFVVPRFVTNPEGGFAAGASAVLTLLAMLFATSMLSLYLLAITLQAYKELSMGPRIAGILPSCILAMALIFLILFLRY